ncbi:drug/metabolite transporter (DMT)-like permease [Mesorhizobium soli]|uniref:DMT family transporter n=1 Tax=Pseudaminobacter soli (ex Li et al. 2025) TaxID=1295366 RepID=UPI0024731BC3|nr:DMT family transporter [Mesorhizobium soli]MDH6235104.1 drug/metabolite transporter (DMT)-like permease [Mesorhizobium soli]
MSVTDTPQRREAIDATAAAIMIFLTVSWGLNGVAAKFANIGFSPVFLSMARSAIGGLIVYAWCWYRGVRLFERDGTLPAGILAGLLFSGEFLLVFIGLQYTTVARSTLLLNAMPFWVLVGAHFLLGERMTLQKWFGLALAFAGVVVVFSDKLSSPGPQALTGDVMALLAGGFWAATTLVIRSTKLANVGSEKLLLYQLVVATVTAIPLLPVAGPVFRDITWVPITAVLFQAVYVVAFTYIVWFWLLRRYPAAGLSSFAFLTPAFGVLFGGALLGEPLGQRMYLALGLIVCGIIVVNRRIRRPPV